MIYSISFTFFKVCSKEYSSWRIGFIRSSLLIIFITPFIPFHFDYLRVFTFFSSLIAFCAEHGSGERTDNYLDRVVQSHFLKFKEEPTVATQRVFNKVIKKMSFPKSYLEPIVEEDNKVSFNTPKNPRMPVIPEMDETDTK